jgi:hypothetical protein
VLVADDGAVSLPSSTALPVTRTGRSRS